MLEDLKKNLEHEKKIVVDMRSIAIGYRSDPANRDFYVGSLKALAEQLDLLNNAVPGMLREWVPIPEGKVINEEVKKVKPKKLELFASRDVVPAKKEKVSKKSVVRKKKEKLVEVPVQKETVKVS